MLILAMTAVASALDCQTVVDDITANDIRVPGAIPYKNEKFNLEVGGEPSGYAIIKDRAVTDISCNGTVEDPTYTLQITSLDIIDEISKSAKPVDRINEAFKEKEIVMKGATVGKKIKGFFTRFAVKLGSWFT